MHYFALLLGPEPTEQPDAATEAAIMRAYVEFHAAAGPALRAGDALTSAASAVRITGGPDAPTVTDGPFAEGAEVAGGYYVMQAENLDDALELARQIPACASGGVEVWPMVEWNQPADRIRDDWLALLLEPAETAYAPDSDEWVSGARQHEEFGKTVGDHILAGAALHPPSTATTVRVRDGRATFTDGPYAEGAEVANGFYVLRAADRNEAVKLASMIPATVVELRRLADVGGL
ncbi:MAG: transcription initiation protein [Mycolicibacterium sp.]|nr:transcription initiation protein [Mycolicibacterium sp.]